MREESEKFTFLRDLLEAMENVLSFLNRENLFYGDFNTRNIMLPNKNDVSNLVLIDVDCVRSTKNWKEHF